MEENKKETAQEVPVQEQYIGKCIHCGKINKLPVCNGSKPKYCMECGKAILYRKSQLL